MKHIVLKPKLPTFDKYQKYLELMDKNQVYSNFGALNSLLEERIAKMASISPEHVKTVSSATSGITCALYALKEEGRKYCIIPSWTFVGTASAVINAGLEPIFVDVDRESWALDQEKTKRALEKYGKDVAGIVVVAPFGNVVNLKEWERLSKEYDVPVIVDAATCFDGFVSQNLEKIGNIPVIISTHATKVFSTGEGGIVLCKNKSTINKIKTISNFGIERQKNNIRIIDGVGINAKLSEFHAAVGLGFLDIWDEYSKEYRNIVDYYLNKLEENNIEYFYPKNSVSTALSIISKDAKKLENHLESNGVMTKKWWDNGCHKNQYHRGFKREDLDVTEELSDIALGIPLFIEITKKDIDYIVKTIKNYDK